MMNEECLIKKQQKQKKVIFRDIDGHEFEVYFNDDEQIIEKVRNIYRENLDDINVVYKGRLVEGGTFRDNRIDVGCVIHILKGGCKDLGLRDYLNVDYKGRLYRIEYKGDDIVMDLKRRIQREILLGLNLQRIQYKGEDLEQERLLNSYGIQKQGILNLRELDEGSNYEEQLGLIEEEILLGVNVGRLRRGSVEGKECLYENKGIEKNSNFEPLYKSDYGLGEKIKNGVEGKKQGGQGVIRMRFGDEMDGQGNRKGYEIGKGLFIDKQKGQKMGDIFNENYEDDGFEGFKFENRNNQIFNLQDAFGNLMSNGNQLVLCQSYYDYQDKKIVQHGSSTEMTKSGGQVNDSKECLPIKKQFKSQEILVQNKIGNIRQFQQSLGL